MAILHIPRFHGIAPRLAPRKLANEQSQIARNCELFSEELRSIREPIEVNTPAKTGIKESIYKLGSIWLHWLTDVDVARSPLYLENELRIHYSGDNNPKSTDFALSQLGVTEEYPETFYRLGLPRPDDAPTVGHTGGTGNDIQRSYVYTFVTKWGEEGPPSPAGSHVGKADSVSWDITNIRNTFKNQWSGADISSVVSGATLVTVTLSAGNNHFLETTECVVFSGAITGTGSIVNDLAGTWEATRTGTLTFTIPLATSGTYTSGLTIDREAPINTTGLTKRLYRTLGGSFRFVADVAGTSYTDSIADEDIGELIPGGIDEPDWWKAPNGSMTGMTTFPGGILAGFFGNTLAFSEPNVSGAWPEAYRYTFNYDIVSIGVVGNTVVVTTKGFPSVVTGDHPSSMVQSELEIFQSCISKRGTVSLFNGVMYPSPDGIVYVPSVGVPSIITRPFFKKNDWGKIAPSTLISSLYDDRYYGFFTGGGDNLDESGAIIFDPKEPGATFTTLAITATAVYSDLESDSLYMMRDDEIIKYDSGGGFLTYTWLSKLYTTAYPLCFKAAKVKLTTGTSGGSSVENNPEAVAAAITALETQLEATKLSTVFGSKNNFMSGSIGGGSVAKYSMSGGPYMSAISSIKTQSAALMLVYAHYDDGGGTIERHLVHTQDIDDDKPFRMPGGYLADQWEVEINGDDVRIHEILLGTSMRALSRA